MADITGASLGSIKNRLSGAATYHPMEAETFSDWATEAGDVVTVKRGNESYNSPVYSSKLVWKGAPQMTLSSTGNKERESLQKVSSKKYRKNGAAVRNSQNQRYFVEDLYKQMRAGLDLTSSSASLYVEDNYRALRSGLDLTSSSASLYVESKYDAMKSGLDLTMSSASLYVESKYDAMKSGLDLTSSSAALYVENKYTAMKSGLDLTMSSAAVYVESLYNQMKAGLDVTSSSAALYAYNRTTRAQIIARINGEGKSEALIEAQNIKIGSRNNSDIKLNDRITIDSSGNLEVGGNLFVSLTGNPDYYVRTKKVKLIGASSSQGAQETDLTYSDVASMIVQAQVSGNTLYLWKKGDTLTTEGASFSFSKATTVGPTWSSGNFPLTIDATQTNGGVTTNVGSYTIGFTNASQIHLEIDKNGDVSAFGNSKKSINVPYKITEKKTVNGVNQDSIRYTGSIAAVDATSVYNNGFNDVTLTGPTWATNPNSDNTTASNSVSVSADSMTDGTSRIKNIPIGLYVDRSNKQAYVSANGYKRAVVSLSNVYGDGWTAARDTVHGETYQVSGVNYTYYYFPTSEVTASARQSYMKVAKPNETVDGAKSDFTYHVTGGSGVAYIRYGNASGPIVASATHNYVKTQAEYNTYGQTRYEACYNSLVDSSTPNATLYPGNTANAAVYLTDKNGVVQQVVSHSYTVASGYYNATEIQDMFEEDPDDGGFDVSVNGAAGHEIGGYENGGSGYYLSGNGRGATAAIVMKGTFKVGTTTISGYSYLETAPTNLYRKGFDNGRSSSHNITSFDTKSADDDYTYNFSSSPYQLSNNDDGYVLSGSGENALAYIVIEATWNCDGQSQTEHNYIAGGPTALYRKGYSDGKNDNTSTTVENLAIYNDSEPPGQVTSRTLSAGSHIDMWAGVDVNGSRRYGSKVTITAANPTLSVVSQSSWWMTGAEANAKSAAAQAMGCSQSDLTIKTIGSSPSRWCWCHASTSNGRHEYVLIGF